MLTPRNSKVLVLGASPNPSRYANRTIKQLLYHGYDVYGIAKKEFHIEKVTIFSKPQKIDNVHTITIYLSPVNQAEYFDYIKQIKPQRVIFNPGTENVKLEQELQKEEIPYIRACTLVLLSTGQF
ncbi:MAG: CoA-binding protein [Bacteroidia bacterium]|nr:MAG: CoA-binding protein [Bacteroidia bacterium]